MKKYDTYDSTNIEVLNGMEGIRRRSSMYIGNTLSEGLHQCLMEAVTNAVDEAALGYGKVVEVTILKDGFKVRDFGRGMPIDNHPKFNRPTLEILFTELHSGGKLTAEANYKNPMGQYGIGCKVLNALSNSLIIEVFKDKKHYRQSFSKGHKTSELTLVDKTMESGTLIEWHADDTIFETTEMNIGKIRTTIKDMSYLNPGIIFELIDERSGKKEEIVSKRGIADMMDEIVNDNKLFNTPVSITGEQDKTFVEILFTYTENNYETIISYANGLRMKDDGTHVSGFRAGFTKAVNTLLIENKKINSDQSFDGKELREGLTAIISVKLPDPMFENQTKTRLSNSYLTSFISKIVYDYLIEYLRRHNNILNTIYDKAMKARKVKQAIAKAREINAGTKELSKRGGLSNNLSNCISKKSSECELFIVEGISAGGTVKKARDCKHQAVYTLRGKVLNTENLSLSAVLENAVLRELIMVLGCGVGDEFNINKLRYDKIIITTDADPDGSDIRLLLLTFFLRHMPDLVLKGHIYYANPPLFQVNTVNKSYYCMNEKELEKLTSKLKCKYEISRLKGLGEMDEDGFRETVSDDKHRILSRITIDDFSNASEVIRKLQGNDSSYRKQLFAERDI